MDESAAASSSSAQGLQDPTPDALRNTPSNIARLEDIIEHSSARHKYLAQTKSPSDGTDVRWYFSKEPMKPNELAASVPTTNIVGKSDYFRFSMRDSLALEASFLQKEEEYLSVWWKEYAECSIGPSGSVRKDYDIDLSHSESASTSGNYNDSEEKVGVPVKGGLYEVDLANRYCFPVYWHGERRRVLRGHWFSRKGGVEWLPLREDVAEQLELAYRCKVWHRRTFQPSGLFAARVELQGCSEGLHALFIGEDDSWEASLIDNSFGFSSSGKGTKLRRGFAPSGSLQPTQEELRQKKEEDMDDYCSQVPVRHLVFMVHGIGQRLEKANLVDDVATFRDIVARLAEEHLTTYQRNAQRVLFIPCQWRRSLKLQGETMVEKCTLDGVRNLRTMLSATVHDVLYYMSPIYCQDIIDSVSNQLNNLYRKFLKRNPGYNGKVSLYGHSLGSVLSYDILCHQHQLSSLFPIENINEGAARMEESSKTNKDSTFTTIESPELSMQDEGCDSIYTCVEDSKQNVSVQPVVDADVQSNRDIRFSEENDASLMHLKHLQGITNESSCDMTEDEISGIIEGKSNNIGLNKEQNQEDTSNQSRSEIDEGSRINEIEALRKEVLSLKSKISELERSCNQEQPVSNTASSLKGNIQRTDSGKHYTPHISFTKLDFKVDTFFAVGSPLGVFLSLRNVRIGEGKGHDYWIEEGIKEEMPCCRQMMNIFHPFDPVAYRVEPLVCKDYVHKRPVFVPYHKGGRRLHIGVQEFSEDLSKRSKAVMKRLNSARAHMINSLGIKIPKNEDEEEDENQPIKTYGSMMMERVTGSPNGRIDFMLQDATFEHAYLQAISSHTSYWRDLDTALFILKHLYREIPPEPQDHSFSDISERKFRPTETSFSRNRDTKRTSRDNVGIEDEDENDVPLTFYGRVTVKALSCITGTPKNMKQD